MLLLGLSACRNGRDARVPVVDLASMLNDADHRPAEARFDIVPAMLDGTVRRAVRTPPTSRISWRLRLPPHAALRTYLHVDPECIASGKGVLFRIGISDGRTYEELLNQWISRSQADWIPILLDLSPYSGFKWSLFYHPSRISWWIVFNTTAAAAPGQPACVPSPLWGAPAILAPANVASTPQ
jgi:hypothetical protein